MKGWLGARDEVLPGDTNTAEGVWRWVQGPEAAADGGRGTVFWNIGSQPQCLPGFVCSWDVNEPNNCCGGEHHLHAWYEGKWNDYYDRSQLSEGFTCEYGGLEASAGPELYERYGVQTLEHVGTVAFKCNPTHFWVMEGRFLDGDLMSPPALNNDFHNTLYTGRENVQQPAVLGCTDVSFSIVTGPARHTQTDAGYTPIVGNFASLFNSNGAFTYVHLPTYGAAVVWNGFDSFRFKATCSAPVTGECQQTAFINVVFTTAAEQNLPPVSFGAAYTTSDFLKCEGSCRDKSEGMWLVRQTLPRLWDMQRDETGAVIKPTISWNGVTKDTDDLDFEWTRNAALVSLYGAVSNLAVRFPTFEVVTYVRSSTPFNPAQVSSQVGAQSTAFDIDCLSWQGSTGLGTDVWQYNVNQQDGALTSSTQSSWYQKFQNGHKDCDIYSGAPISGVRRSCRLAPLMTPRTTQSEDWRCVACAHQRLRIQVAG